MLQSLHKRHSELAESNYQLEILSNGIFEAGDLPKFKNKLEESQQFPLKTRKLEILQINLGYMCNQVCAHCHVDAGPDRVDENMETSVKGVFAIGDIRNTSFKQVVVAASDGCIAAMSIDKYLNSRKQIKVDWIHQ